MKGTGSFPVFLSVHRICVEEQLCRLVCWNEKGQNDFTCCCTCRRGRRLHPLGPDLQPVWLFLYAAPTTLRMILLGIGISYRKREKCKETPPMLCGKRLVITYNTNKSRKNSQKKKIKSTDKDLDKYKNKLNGRPSTHPW